MEVDYSSDASHWSVLMAKLSPASVAQLDGLIDAFAVQVRALADKDRKNGADAQWYAILSSAMEIDLPDYVRRVRAAQNKSHI